MKLEIKKEMRDEVEVVNLIGSLDGSTAEELQNQVVEGIDSESRLVLDMSRCEYVSSAGLRILMITAKTLKVKNGRGALANLIEEVKDVIEMTGFGNVLHTTETVDEAISYVRGE